MSSKNDSGKLCLHVKEWNWTLTLHHTQQLKIERVKQNTWNYKNPRRKHKEKPLWHWSQQWFLGYDAESARKKSKNLKVRQHQAKEVSAQSA